MKGLLRNFGSLLLAGFITAPIAMYAQDRDYDRDDRDHDKNSRVYDPYRHDYHNWNDDEDRTYRQWYGQTYNGREYRDYRKLNKKNQRAYWTYRHDHDKDHDHDNDRH